jgi:hypothetical protein
MKTTNNNAGHNAGHNGSHNAGHHDLIMFIIMLFAGFLSSMNIWVDKWSDIRIHLNDVYMTFLMIGWMFLFMGIYYLNTSNFIIGLLFVITMLYCIRNQVFINENQYLNGMIPHHSMAVLMSRKLLEKYNGKNNGTNDNNNIYLHPEIKQLAVNIISSQQNEINLMKKYT